MARTPQANPGFSVNAREILRRENRSVWRKAAAGCLALMIILGPGLVPMALAEENSGKAPLPANVYGKLPMVSSGAVSPDGKHVALIMATGENRGAIFLSIPDLKPVGSVRVGPEGGKVRRVVFPANDRVLVEMSEAVNPFKGQIGVNSSNRTGLREYYRFISVSLDGKDQVMLGHDFESSWLNTAFTVWSKRIDETLKSTERTIPMAAFEVETSTRVYNLYDVNLTTGRMVLRHHGNSKTREYVLDENGEVVARVDESDANNTFEFFVKEGSNWRSAIKRQGLTGGNPFFSRLIDGTGEFVSVEAEQGTDFPSLLTYDRKNLTPKKRFEIPGVEFSGAIIDPASHTIVGVLLNTDEEKQVFFDNDLIETRKVIGKFFNGASFSLVSWDKEKSKFLVEGEADNGVPAYYLYDRTAQKLIFITSQYPELMNIELGERQAIKYKARDKVGIPAYLTLPAGVPGKKLPMVVFPHGGPAARDHLEFDFIAEFLASRGYAVLQPNFRGSKGFGRTWERAGWREWGGVMQNDVTDGVKALIRAGIADPERICIMGASYGGYAALAGATLTPELYSCAISIAGVSDPLGMLSRAVERNGRESSTVDYWKLSIGDPAADADRIKAISPARHADAARAPILLLHGKEDTVVNVEQSRLMERRLKAAGKPVTLIELNGDDHWLSIGETRIALLEHTERFLAQHLAAKVPAEPAAAASSSGPQPATAGR